MIQHKHLPSKIRAVTFDVGGTLIDPWPSVGAVYAAVAKEFNIECSPDRLTDSFLRAWRSREAFGYTRREWHQIVRESFAGQSEVSENLFEGIYNRFAQPEHWLIYDDVIPAIQHLENRGFKLGIISNWDERLVPLLENLGLKSYFPTIIVSSAIGSHKPEPRIFQYAAEQLQCRPDEVLHIGDSLDEDLKGARAAGLSALWLRRSGTKSADEIQSLIELFRP